ncbi:MAG: F0F1 ATP synthase subunit B [Oscillospiraceae bacterium]|jgi:F-type H+-transporting ATPase subunit b
MEGLNPLDIVVHIISIVVLFLLLRLLVYKPVRAFISKREGKVAKQLEDADAAEQKAKALQTQCSEELTEAKAQALQIVRGGEEKAIQSADSILDNAKKEAGVILENARKQTEEDRRRAIASMQEDLSNLTLEIAGRILRRELRLEDNRAVAEDFFKKAE